MSEKEIDSVENLIGYKFSDKNLLISALTHQSYVNEHGAVTDCPNV